MTKRNNYLGCKGKRSVVGIGLFSLLLTFLALSFFVGCKSKESAQSSKTPTQNQTAAEKGNTHQPAHSSPMQPAVQALFKEDPESYEEYQNIQNEFRSGKYAAGIKRMEKLYAKSPQAPWAETVKFQLVHVKRLRKDFKGALDENNDFLRFYPDSKMVPRAKFTEGEIYLSMAQEEPVYFEKALGVFNRISSEYPELKSEADYRLGTTYFSMADYQQAKGIFEKIIDEQPHSIFAPKAMYSLAVLYLSQADTDRAQQIYKELMVGYPDDLLAKKVQAKLQGMALIGQKAPAFQIKEWIGDPPENVEAYQKKLTIISFWGIWCGHCRKNLPKMNRLVDIFSSKDVLVIGISREKGKYNAEAIKKFIDSQPSNFSTAVDNKGKTSIAYSVANVPCIVIVNANGKVCWVGHPDFLMDETIEVLLSKP